MEPQPLDDHYVTVNDPTTIRHLLAGRPVSIVDEHAQVPAFPVTTRPLSTAGGHSGGAVLRVRRRTDSHVSPAAAGNRESMILYDKQQMERLAKHTNHRPSYRRLASTPSDRYYPVTPTPL